MKQVFVSTACAIAFAALVTGCASETEGGSSEFGTVSLNIIIDGNDVNSVAFDIACDSGTNLSGQLNVNDEDDPPIAATVMDLPPGPCSVTLTALDDSRRRAVYRLYGLHGRGKRRRLTPTWCCCVKGTETILSATSLSLGNLSSSMATTARDCTS